MTSSILSIMEVASVDALTICSLTARGSTTFSSIILDTLPPNTSTPAHISSALCFVLSSVSMSIVSSPAFSASASGIVSRASANLIAASCSLPVSFVAHSLTCNAASDSGAPPPATILGFSTTSFTTLRASWRERSASSTTLSLPPRISNVMLLGSLHPSMNTHLSSSIFLSSASSAHPRSFSVRSSRLVTTLPPVAFESFSMSDCFTLRIASIPSFAI